mgnify:CR=1
MGLINQAIQDTAIFTSNLNAFGVPIVITDLAGNNYNVVGLHSKHHLSISGDGKPVNQKNAHITFHESQLTNQGKSIRNAKNEVNLSGYLVAVKDSTGISKDYVITQWFPNETTGLIICLLAVNQRN